MHVRRSIALCLVLALHGCGDDDNFSPTVDTVAGTYAATTFTLSLGMGTVNQLILGSKVDLTLAPDGTTSGHLFMPGGGENGSDLDVDLTGTWTLTNGAVTFDYTPDSFLRDVRFDADRNRLIARETFGHNITDLVLTKTE